MRHNFYRSLQQQLDELQNNGLYKRERYMTTSQSVDIDTTNDKSLINLCANNYLGLADHPELIAAAHQALDDYGYGMASVRFICGTQIIHRHLEEKLASFLGFDDAILYASCFDANAGLFETLLGADDAIISDSLNHASIIDGVRLCKARRYRYQNNDMVSLEKQLQQAKADGVEHILIATDGVFSMDGIIANLPAICDLADRYDALLMVDDSHAVGFMGDNGRGSHEYCQVMGRIDIMTGTLGKALGGASGGYTVAKAAVVEWLRQRSRPYLFSNSVAPVIVATSIAVIEYLNRNNSRIAALHDNTRYFRNKMMAAGFTISGQNHPIVPVMIGDAALAVKYADLMLAKGIYVIGFSYPVVPKGKARIRTQISAAHTREQLDKAIAAFVEVGLALGIICH